MTARDRPLSPHILIYAWPWTMLLSLGHRASGVGLSAGTLLLVYWLVAAAAGPESYAMAQAVLSHWLGRLFLFGWTWALFYHLCNGVRHLFWDAGLGFELRTAMVTGLFVVAASLVLTALTWLVGYGIIGG